MINGAQSITCSRRRAAMVAFGLAIWSGVVRASEPNAQRVNHFMGAVGESVAIQVPPYHGIEPRLSVSYSSEARNGFAGMGWSLSGVSVIERVNGAWGVPQFSSDDVYTLDGQTLLECPPGSAYPSCASGGTHYTHQESYLKVKRVNDGLWEVYGRDGTRTDFSPIHTVTTYEGGPIYSLRLGQSKVVDTHLNTVTYNWTINSAGVVGNTYLSSIDYNGYRVELHREPRPDIITRPAFSGVARLKERLQAIVVRLATGAVIRGYRLAYTTSAATGKSLLASVQMFGKDFWLDSVAGTSGGTALPAQTFAYQGDAAVASFTGDVQMSNAGPPATDRTLESVVWTYRTNTTATGDGSTLTADAMDPAWDKVGYSTRSLSSGLGYLEFTYTGGQQFAAYLGAYGAQFPAAGSMTINGPGVGATGPFPVASGQVVRIEVVSDGVAFAVGGTTVGLVPSTPAYPMVAFASFYQGGDAVADARLFGSLVNHFEVACGGSPRFFGDFNGDGRKDSVCRTANGDLAVTLATPAGFSNPTTWANLGNFISGVGDFNNDGRDDIVSFDSYWGIAYVGLSDGVDFGAISSWGLIDGYMYGGGGGHVACRMNGAALGKVADYNGDGRADVACYVPGSAQEFVGISTGASFSGSLFGEFGCQEPYGNLASQGQADFNGDGRDDWYCTNTYNGDVSTFFSVGTFFYQSIGLTSFCSANEYSFGDWNGDGTTDAACANNLRAGLQTGRLFSVLNHPDPNPPSYCVTGQRLAADLDGDGAAEWICNNPGAPGNDIEVRRWTGLGFGPASTWRGGFCAGTLKAADFNGDSKQDLLCESTGAAIYAGTKNLKADLLNLSVNETGGSTSLAYVTNTEHLTGSSSAGLPAKYLVESITISDGTQALPASTLFFYRTGIQNDKERKFFGFQSVWENSPMLANERGRPSIERRFRIDSAAAGSLEDEVHYSDSGILSRTSYEYATTETTGAGARRTKQLAATWNYRYTGLSSLCQAWPCPDGRRTKREFTYDVYGNPLVVVDHGDFDVTGDETSTATSYTPNPSAYIVGLPGRVSHTVGTNGEGDTLGIETYSYDGANAWTTPPVKGDMTKRSDYLGETGDIPTASNIYDSYGNLTSSTDATNRSVTFTYDTTYHIYPTAAANGASETTSTTWDALCGMPVTTIDPNNVTAALGSDILCRSTTTTLPSPYGTVAARSYANLGNPANQMVQVDTPGPDGSSDWSASFFDGFGRTYRAVKRGPSSTQPIVIDYEYDARGNLRTQTAPYYHANETPKVTTFEYDPNNRRTQTTLPDGKTRLTSYPGLSSEGFFQVVQTNELGQSTVTRTDVLGRVRQIESTTAQHGPLVATRNYDIRGRMTSLIDPVGNSWEYTYDLLGRLTAKDDPDAGHWTYTYDDAGRVVSQTDANGQTTTFEYDAAGRLQYRKARPIGGVGGAVTEYVETTYGTSAAAHNIGRVTQVVTKNVAGVEQSGKLSFEYDSLGRVTKQTRTIDGTAYPVEKNFDAAGYLRGMKYPDNDTIGQFGGAGTVLGYDQAGRLSTIPGILSGVTYNALGAPLVQTNANGTTTTKTYDANRFWLTDIDTTAPSLVLQNLHYTPNDAGMVMAVDSDISNEDWTYTYDELNRLTASTNGVGGNDQTWAYDSLGRFTSNSRAGTTFTYPGAGAARPHAPTSISGGPLGSLNFSYDPNGNLMSGNGRSYTWNENNQITQVIANSATTIFAYGPDGNRIKKTSGASVAKYPFGDDYEIDAGGTVTKYFNAGFGPIAKKVGSTLYWLHTDRLGSINATTDASGAQVLRRSHRAYGELLAQTGSAAVSEFPTVGNPGTSKQVTVNRAGRYVRVQLPRTDYLHMAEVQVFGPTGINLALGRPATQSSTAYGGVASVAVDGSTDGNSVTHTGYDAEPWWQVDLGAEYSIASVVVWNRTTCCQERLSDFSVFVSSTPFMSGSMAITRLSSSESLGYIGQRTDQETGLTYLHARYYDSALGLFISPDPIGADRNTYRYAGGDPANFVDPSGLEPRGPDEGRGGSDELCARFGWACTAQEAGGGYGGMGGPGPGSMASSQSGLEETRSVVVTGNGYAYGSADPVRSAVERGGGHVYNPTTGTSIFVNPVPTGTRVACASCQSFLIGIGDGASFGLTLMWRESQGLNQYVDRSSGAYMAGTVSGSAATLLAGSGAIQATAAMSRATLTAAAVRVVSAPALILGPRVIQRAKDAGDTYHNFPSLIDPVIMNYGSRTVLGGGYIQYSYPGSINGVNGAYIIGGFLNSANNTLVATHRFFDPRW